jgi:hypothetical protein
MDTAARIPLLTTSLQDQSFEIARLASLVTAAHHQPAALGLEEINAAKRVVDG